MSSRTARQPVVLACLSTNYVVERVVPTRKRCHKCVLPAYLSDIPLPAQFAAPLNPVLRDQIPRVHEVTVSAYAMPRRSRPE